MLKTINTIKTFLINPLCNFYVLTLVGCNTSFLHMDRKQKKHEVQSSSSQAQEASSSSTSSSEEEDSKGETLGEWANRALEEGFEEWANQIIQTGDPHFASEIFQKQYHSILSHSPDYECFDEDSGAASLRKIINTYRYLKSDFFFIYKSIQHYCAHCCSGESGISLKILESKIKACYKGDEMDENIKYGLFYGSLGVLLGLAADNPSFHSVAKQVLNDSLHFMRDRGINVNKQLQFFPGIYETGLMWMIAMGPDFWPEFTLMLLHGFEADPFILDNQNKNALHLLLLKGKEEQRCIVEAVLQYPNVREHINDVTVGGDTALHIACARRDVESIRQLLQKGADISIKNANEQTAIDVLHMKRAKRIKFLSKYLIKGYNVTYRNYPGYENELADVATIDDSIFNTDASKIQSILEEFVKK